MKTNEEYVGEFQLLLEQTVLYKLENFATKNDEDLITWLRTTLEAKDKECEERVRKDRERISMIIGNEAGMNYPHQSKESNALWTVLEKLNPAPTKTDKTTEV